MKYKMIGVMCGSSNACDNKFLQLAYDLGQELGKTDHEVIYGGGAKGLMRKVADGALDAGANVHGYMPEFMIAVEWQHDSLTQLHITRDMAERKYRMMTESDATIFLPGGCGTMEEFFEWLSAKRLGKYTGPLIIFNFENYYDPLLQLLENMEKERFHNPEHRKMWTVCNRIEDIHKAFDESHEWSEDAINNASVRIEK